MKEFSKMAEISDTVKQLGERVEYFPQYKMTTASFIGPESQLSAMAAANKKGDKYDSIANTVIQSSVTEKMEADRLRWNVSYKTWLSGGGGGGGDDPYISRVWSMNMTQYEFPLDRYLDPENAEKYNAWKNTDLKQRKQWKYLLSTEKENGTPVYGDLSGMALSCAQKYFAGIESVMRFYPQATRTSIYEKQQEFEYIYGNLNHIDNTPSAVYKFDCEWLKSGADWTENSDTTWTLVESWIGAPHWDEELYGLGAWDFYEQQ